MFGSGVAIGMVRTALQPRPTPRVRRRVASVFCVAVAGTTTRTAVVQRFVTITIRLTVAATTVSV